MYQEKYKKAKDEHVLYQDITFFFSEVYPFLYIIRSARKVDFHLVSSTDYTILTR